MSKSVFGIATTQGKAEQIVEQLQAQVNQGIGQMNQQGFNNVIKVTISAASWAH